jgi:hypothetical protein
MLPGEGPDFKENFAEIGMTEERQSVGCVA